jgi:hypothetical protein
MLATFSGTVGGQLTQVLLYKNYRPTQNINRRDEEDFCKYSKYSIQTVMSMQVAYT